MFRIARKYMPQTIIELGTSLGITSSYLALGNPGASVLTCEGAPGIAGVAMRNFKDLNLGNIELIQGNFDATLPITLDRVDTVDLVFIDGNHRYAPTLDYFAQIMEKNK